MSRMYKIYAGPGIPGQRKDPSWRARLRKWMAQRLVSGARCWSVWCDGSFRPDHTAQLGIHVERPNGLRSSHVYRLTNVASNWRAEALAMRHGLDIVLLLGARRVRLITDHQGLADQLSGRSRWRESFRADLEHIAERLGRFQEAEVVWVPRRQNWLADYLSRVEKQTVAALRP